MKKTRKRFQKALKKNNLSIYKLAKALNIGKSIAYHWLWGDTVPSLQNLIKLKTILNVSGDEILEMFAEEAT